MAALALMVLVTAACSGSAGASPTPQISPLANSDWTLTTTEGRAVPSGMNVTLLFGVARASGFSGCNQYSAPYATVDTGLRFGPTSGTRASCGTVTDTFESGYYSDLSNVTHWAISNDSLQLITSIAGADLIYARMAPATVEGPWNITMVNNGQGAVSSVPSGVSASITFQADGTVEGFGGCNSFSGGYSRGANDQIAIGPLLSTMKACGDPADTFEHQLLTALQSATKWSVTSGTLDLRDDGGAQQVAATSAIGL